jgi:hypothetical protein
MTDISDFLEPTAEPVPVERLAAGKGKESA